MSRKRKQEDIGYESPRLEMLRFESEQMLAGSTFLDNMTESWGEWESDLISNN